MFRVFQTLTNVYRCLASVGGYFLCSFVFVPISCRQSLNGCRACMGSNPSHGLALGSSRRLHYDSDGVTASG